MDGRTSNPPDHELVANLDWVRRLALALTRDREAAEDMTQDVARVWLERRPVLADGPRGWLAAVARRLALDRTRSEAARRSRERSIARAEKDRDFEVVERGARQRRVAEAVMTLEEPYRSTILYRYLDGLETRVVAERTGVCEATVRKRLERGLAHLRKRLDREFGERTSDWVLALLDPERRGMERVMMENGTWAIGSNVAIAAMVAGSVALLVSAAWMLRVERGEAEVASGRTSVVVPPEIAEAREVAPRSVASASEGPREAATETGDPVSAASPSSESANASQAVLTGRVVCRESRAAVGGHPVVVLGPDGPCETITAEDGTFSCRSITAPGRYSVVVGATQDFGGRAWIGDETMANEPPILSLDWKPGDAPTDLALTLGPTLPLDLALPPGLAVTDFEVELEAAVAFPPPPGIVAAGLAAPVQQGDRGQPFVRIGFGPVGATFAHQDTLWRLRVTSADGLWSAETPVPRTFGRREEPVRIDLTPSACLELGFQRDGGSAARGIEVEYAGLGGARPARIGRARAEDSADSARVVLRGLPPDAYRLDVRAQGCEPIGLELSLRGGETLRHEVHLVPLAGAGAVRGRLSSRTGSFDLPVHVVLTSPDRSDVRRVAVEWIEDEGRLVAPFAFEGLPSGEPWRLGIQPREVPPEARRIYRIDHWSWSPAPGEVVAPSDGLEFVYEDDLPLAPLEFFVSAAETGLPVDGATVLMEVGGHLTWPEPTGERGHLSAKVAVGPPLRWVVRAPGHVLVTGDRSAVLGGAIDVQLERGWGTTVRVYGSGGSALPDVEVVMDGVPVGITDAKGLCSIRREREPGSIAFRLPGWRWSAEDHGSRLSPDLWGVSWVRMDPAD